MVQVLLALLSSTPTHAGEATVTAQLWTHRSEAGAPGERAFVLWAPELIEEELAGLAVACGYATRAATDADLRRSHPVLSVRASPGERGRPVVDWDLRASRDVALVQLWVELRALQASGRELGPAGRAYVSGAVF